MKKRVLTIFATFVSAASIVTSIAITKSDDSIFKISGQDEPSLFQLDYSTVTSISDDTYQVLIRNNKGSAVRVNIKGATYENGYFYSSEPKDHSFESYDEFSIYNVDPIRGINTCSIQFYCEESFTISSHKMFSYNQIDFSEVLKGRYQDLAYSHFEENQCYEKFFPDVCKSTDIEGMSNSRYFLYHYIYRGFYYRLRIEKISFESVCFEEPASVSIGENFGTLSSNDLRIFKEEFDDCLNIENVGNPVFGWVTAFNGKFFQYFNKDQEAPFISRLIEQGFELTFTNQNVYHYQKNAGNKVHTIGVEIVEYRYSNKLKALYYDNLDYLNTFTSWPKNCINDFLDDDYKNLIPILSPELILKYKISGFETLIKTKILDYYNTLEIKPLFEEECSEEMATALVSEYVSDFDASIWSISKSYSGVTICSYFYGLLSVKFSFNNGEFLMTISETIRRFTPYTAKEIADLHYYQSEKGIYAVDGGSGAVYVYHQKSFSIYNFEDGTYERARQGFETNGYVCVESGNNYAKYRKKLNIFDDYLQVYISDQSMFHDYKLLTVEYRFEVASVSKYDSFVNLIGYCPYCTFETANMIANRLNLNSTYEFYYVSVPGSYDFRLIKNADANFISQFKSEFIDYYIEAFDAYRFEGDEYCLKLEEVDGAVKLTFNPYPMLSFNNYNQFNDFFASFINENSYISELSIELLEEDNLGLNFYNDGSDSKEYFYGTYEAVNSFKSILINKIDENGLFTYSSYLDKYINIDSGFGISLKTNEDSANYSYLCIELFKDNQYKDYESFNDLNFDSISLLNSFPLFVNNDEKEEKYFVNLSIAENDVTFDVIKTCNIKESYRNALLNAGFSKLDNNTYEKFDNGYLYTYSLISDNESNTYSMNFHREGPFLNRDGLLESVGAKNAEYLNEFKFSEYFNSYHYVFYAPNFEEDHTVVVAATGPVYSYLYYLTQDGYVEINEPYKNLPNSYVYSSEDGNSFKIVRHEVKGILDKLIFEKKEFQYKSWENIKDEFINIHEYEANKNYLIYPDDAPGYLCENIGPTSITFIVNKNYDISTYTERLISADNYKYRNTRSNRDKFVFDDGYVAIEDYYIYYKIIVCSNHFTGNSVDNPISVVEGSNNIILKGDFTYFKFVPTKTADYRIFTESNLSTFGLLYDSYDHLLAQSNGNNGRSNFVYRYRLNKDETYYIAVRLFDVENLVESIAKLNIEIVSYDGQDTGLAIDIYEGVTDFGIRNTNTYFKFTPQVSGTYKITLSSDYYNYLGIWSNSYIYSLAYVYGEDSVSCTVQLTAETSYYIYACGEKYSIEPATLLIELVKLNS